MKDLWVSVSGAIAQQREVDTVANNIANAATPGFKRDQLVFKEHLSAFEKGAEVINLPRKEWSPEDFYHSYGSQRGYVKVDGKYTDFEQGQLSPTGNPFDLALNGKGFFEILTPNGVRYTRKGTFTMNPDGLLVNEKGYPVLSGLPMTEEKDGEAEAAPLPQPEERLIKLDGTSKFSINLQGEIYQNGLSVGNLAVVEFKDPHALKKEGNSSFINQHSGNFIQASATVHQGFVEESNVNAVSEMTRLIKANRQFESIQQAIKAYDQISEKGTNEIAKF